MPMTSSLGLQEALSKAEQFARERDYAGADPYDGLTSPVAGLVRGPLSRQLLLQSVKRSPIPLRKALAIRPIRMAKAVALFSDGYRLLGQEDYADRLADQLLATMGGGPWGYEFDVQTRWAYYKAGTPNVIATAFAVRALDRLDRLHEVNPAVLDWLYSLIDSRGYFHYTPASSALIHNGNLLAAEAVARLNGDADIISRALQVTLSQQNRDGSWTYGEDPKLAWIDNFHTVYVLESLRTLGSRGFEIGESLALGIDYWQNSLFTRDGMPLYFAGDSQPSKDVHNIATVVGALPLLAADTSSSNLEHPAVKLLIAHQGDDGGFRNSPSSTPYMRWNQAHAFRALAMIYNCTRSVHD